MSKGDDDRFEPFWQWFLAQRHSISTNMRSEDADLLRETVRQVDEQLEIVAPGVGFVYGVTGTPNRFVLTAKGIPERIPLVEAMLASAPALDDWEFVAFRPPTESTSDLSITMGDYSLAVVDVLCHAFDLGAGGVGVTLYPRQMNDENRDALEKLATILMDHVIGEYAAMAYIDSLRVDPQSEMPSTAVAVPLSQLRQFLEEIQTNRSGN